MDLDSVDVKTAFKMGFVAYCADNGMSKESTAAFIEKSAAGWGSVVRPLLDNVAKPALKNIGKGFAWAAPFFAMDAVKGVGTTAKELAPVLAGLGVGVPVASGLALGSGLGWGAAKLNEPDITPEDIKAKELADTYKQYTDRLQARRAYQQYRQARGHNS